MHPILTHSIEVTVVATRDLKRVECHGTATGTRSVVEYDGQLYEILVNPMHKYAEVPHA